MPPAGARQRLCAVRCEAPPLPPTLARPWSGSPPATRPAIGLASIRRSFVAMRRWEVAQYNRVVDRWQRERYLEMI